MARRKQVQQYPQIKNPHGKMLREGRSILQLREVLKNKKPLDKREIHEIKAEIQLYKHAMNLSEELWKHYNSMRPKTKAGKKKMEAAKKLAEEDYNTYQLRYEILKEYLETRKKK